MDPPCVYRSVFEISTQVRVGESSIYCSFTEQQSYPTIQARSHGLRFFIFSLFLANEIGKGYFYDSQKYDKRFIQGERKNKKISIYGVDNPIKSCKNQLYDHIT